ncbi:hypothetical protein PILCRDRAFT_820337 [Piloderma croceum F 1598]|uniref:Microbial-type PARG catalytic domain-containing protein n=1 Tax=Piloderma croceum (strain F 1598) TaxID=765440 RepID=A0A0C3B843_PILCF|nr:hypothetical protein PILCRDRAFT_820337 [Piloderma croceum F 1598]
MPFKPGAGPDIRNRLRKIAEESLSVIESGSYTLPNSDVTHNLCSKIESLKSGTRYYPPDSPLSNWSSPESSPLRYAASTPTDVSILEISTMNGARRLSSILASENLTDKLGILNFASAHSPGGGFINGAQAQEESLARSSTLYPSLMTNTGQQFYALHQGDLKGGYYTHAMIYSPGVVFFRDDDGGWTEPLEADVLVSAAVNAGAVRNSLHWRASGKDEEVRIEAAMRERMARVLFLFSEQGIKNVVLGSFGTGVFQNNVTTVAKLWADLLVAENARFKRSFDRVVFAILGTKTCNTFKETFEEVKACEN